MPELILESNDFVGRILNFMDLELQGLSVEEVEALRRSHELLLCIAPCSFCRIDRYCQLEELKEGVQ